MKKPLRLNEKGVRIRFQLDTEFKVIQAAAARRGVSFNTFVRITSANAARRILTDVPVEIPGTYARDLEELGIPAA